MTRRGSMMLEVKVVLILVVITMMFVIYTAIEMRRLRFVSTGYLYSIYNRLIQLECKERDQECHGCQ